MAWRAVFVVAFIGVATEARDFRNAKRDVSGEDSAIVPCPNPCSCPVTGRDCTDCRQCPRQVGEPCNEENRCDLRIGLACKYKHGDPDGICRESSGVPCVVYNRTYRHGETFNLDCRTQCVCQNGTYGCSSLCPQEYISPRGCQHPRLVDVPGQCCREWMCDSQTEQPPSCEPVFSRWTGCSSRCGSGMSSRESNLNARCLPETETRICQTRRCANDDDETSDRLRQHHLRKGHECKATHRLGEAVFLRFGPCRSRKRFRPKYCGTCPAPGSTCSPTLSTTVRVDFICEGAGSSEKPSDLLLEYLEPGADLWADQFPPKYDSDDARLITLSVQWVLKCRCGPRPSKTTSEPPRAAADVVLHRVHRTSTP
ncbi:CCN family member 4 isoform X2 [Cylas formicarius]|uniref:CCN family member 4 isoform X2 n=1 Tax=Cylas formicarius TaxID=197179 RepID=UPI002958B4AE|nr:CCN family member 4 isoform X2 [Cylas formicarius]